MLEQAVAIAEGALGGRHAHEALGREIPSRQRVEALGQLQAIGADVLDRRGAATARNERQVLEPGTPHRQKPLDGRVPVLAGADLQVPGVARFAKLPQSRDLHLDRQAVEVAGQQQVAAAAEHQPRQPGEPWIGGQRGEILGAAHPAEPARPRLDAEAVQSAQGVVFVQSRQHRRTGRTSLVGRPVGRAVARHGAAPPGKINASVANPAVRALANRSSSTAGGNCRSRARIQR